MDKDFIDTLGYLIDLIEREQYEEAADILFTGFLWREHESEEEILGMSWARLHGILKGEV